MEPMTPSEIQSLKSEVEYWANNCGGCETCARVFGDKNFSLDDQSTYSLIMAIEARDDLIKQLQEVLSLQDEQANE